MPTLYTEATPAVEIFDSFYYDHVEQKLGHAGARNKLDELVEEAKALREENVQLKAIIDQRVQDFLAEKVCCSGQECGCFGVTRLEQAVQEEAGERITALRDAIRLTLEENANLADGDDCTLLRLKQALKL